MIVNGHSLILAGPIEGMIFDKRTEHGVSYGLGEAGYDIRIKQDVFFSGASMNTPTYATTDPNGDIASGVGSFCLASAMEKFDMPDNLVAIVHDKSTWARRGLSVFNTVIEPGWKGFLTLELVYHGQAPLKIPAGAGIAQVLFHRLEMVSVYDGKYQNQEDRPVEAISG